VRASTWEVEHTMRDLRHWLETYSDALIENAVIRLSQDETVKLQITDSVRVFFDALSQAAQSNELTPISTILADWVKGRSTQTDGEVMSLLPLLVTLKQVMWSHVLETCSPDEAIPILTNSDLIFTESMLYLENLENDSLLENMRHQLHKAS